MTRYDLAIINATVVDGTGSPARIDDVAILNGRIAKIGPLRSQANRVIDAFGKVLAPGFIDIHGHSDYSLLYDPLARSKVYQGVTTEVGGNCGYHAAPVFGAVVNERKDFHMRTACLSVDWETSAEYRDRIRRENVSVNYAYQIGYNTLRSVVTRDHAQKLSAAERDQIRTLVRSEYANGALGLSYGLAYAPACFSSTDELIDVAEESKDADAFISFHIRNEDALLMESIEEALEIAKASSAAIHIGHVKTFRRANWHKIEILLGRLESARKEGLDLTVDRYPHLAMNTQFKFILPTWALEGGIGATQERLRNPETRQRICQELAETCAKEVKEVMISLVANPLNKQYEGRFLDELSRGSDPWFFVCDLLADEGDTAFATFFGMNRNNLDRIFGLDYAIVASDASIQAIDKQAGGGRPHPRCFDTFPYFLAEWVYARKLIDLPEAIRRMTLLPAQRAKLKERGVIAEGYHADFVIFDPNSLMPDISYEDPIRYPQGIETVIVNGVVVIDRGLHTARRPGQLLLRQDQI